MAARKHREIHDVQQTKNMVPLITCESSSGFHVCEMVFGINKFDLDLRVQLDSVKSPVKSDSVGSGHVSHRRTPALDDHLDHRFIVLKKCTESQREECASVVT